MPGSNQHSQEEGHERSQESDVFRVLAQHLFRHLDHPVHTSGCLKGSGAGYCRDYYVDDIRRRSAGLETETEYQNRKAYP